MNEVLKSLDNSYFKMIGIGVPADNVQSVREDHVPGPSYITLDCDLVIRYMGGALPTNTICNAGEGTGHEFVTSYLGETNSKIKLRSYINQALIDLRSRPSQFTLKNSPCTNRNIEATDLKNTKVIIDYVLDNNGSVYDVNGTLYMSNQYLDKPLDSFNEIIASKGYLTLINYDYKTDSLLRPSVPEGDEISNYEEVLAILDSTEVEVLDQLNKQMIIYPGEGISTTHKSYLNNEALSFELISGNLYLNSSKVSLKNIALDLPYISSFEEIYRTVDTNAAEEFVEYEVGYCF